MTVPTELKNWIKNLRSGKYKQGKDRLGIVSFNPIANDIDYKESNFCCLGVYAVQYIKDLYPNLESNQEYVYNQFLEPGYLYGLPEITFNQYIYADLTDRSKINQLFISVVDNYFSSNFKYLEDPCVYEHSPSGIQTILSEINDIGTSFEQIADILEEFFNQLFNKTNELSQSQANNQRIQYH